MLKSGERVNRVPRFAMDSDELHQRSDRNLQDFLRIEIELGLTFVSIARSCRERGNMARFKAIKENALAIVKAVDRFETRLPKDMRTEIDRLRSKLTEAISTLQEL
jgi:hypothetical protein